MLYILNPIRERIGCDMFYPLSLESCTRTTSCSFRFRHLWYNWIVTGVHLVHQICCTCFISDILNYKPFIIIKSTKNNLNFN